MTTTKRRRVDEDSVEEICDCGAGLGKAHSSKLSCSLSKQTKNRDIMHIDLTAKIIPASPIVTIFVGPQKQAMYIHKGLLTLHSAYFRELFAEAGRKEEVEENIFVIRRREVNTASIPGIKVSQFGLFIGWLYSNKLNTRTCAISGKLHDRAEGLWQVGKVLQCKDFQNLCLDALRYRAAAGGRPRSNTIKWPSVAEADFVYEITEAGSALRRLVADMLARNNPFASSDENVIKEWKRLLEKRVDLSLDLNLAAGNRRKGQPWDDEHRCLYIEQDVSLGERYRNQILAEKSELQVEEQARARGGDWLSMLELDHLKKAKRSEKPSGIEQK